MQSLAPPTIATRITAEGGRRRYCVVAFRALDYEEMKLVVGLSLELGWVREPEAGEETVIYSSLGLYESPAGATAPPEMGRERLARKTASAA